MVSRNNVIEGLAAIRNEYRLLINGWGFPLPVPLNPGSCPIFVGSCLFALFQLQEFARCCIIFPISPSSRHIGNPTFCPAPFSTPRTPPTPFSPRFLPPCPSLYAKEELNWSNLESNSKPALIPLFPFLLVFI